MKEIIDHTIISFGMAEIPALLVLLLVIVVFVVKNHKVTKEVKELEEKLARKYTEEVGDMENLSIS
ncbi:MAG: hypothetical protein IJ327_03555 [Lachnospiraceae bacterium]|nr:hypothetical protein [Lachnospiraceae bacterium]